MKHKPTDEQQAIIDCDPGPGDVIAVKAFAGTGKTSCLVMFAEAHPKARILYLAYNRAMREDAEKRFPRNTTCKTTHQICWPRFGKQYNDRRKLGSMRKKQIADLMPPRVTRYPHKWENVKAISQTLENFIYSDSKQIDKTHIPTWTRGKGSDKVKKPDLSPGEIIEYANELWNMQTSLFNKTALLDHDGYLKLFQLSNPTLAYDIILFDEAQDANPATLSIVMNQIDHAGVVCVGDPYQQMYAFRGSKNAFDRIEATQTFKLTNSFRFGQNTADLATKMLNHYFKEPDKIIGRGYDTSIKGAMFSLEEEDAESAVYIARTNGNLLQRAIKAMESGYTFGFAGGFNQEIYWTVKAIQDLKSGRFVNHEFIGLFDDYQDLQEYAVEAHDKEIISYMKLLQRYGPGILTKLDDIKRDEVPFQDAEVKLTTAHKSKGLEFDEVWLADDFVPQETEVEGVNMQVLEPEEVNVLYVSVTRGIRRVIMSKDLTDFLVMEGVYERPV
jgi:superfamily I DNA/RNA helicase